MSILAKSVLALRMASLATASEDECNGLNIMGLMTWTADACLNGRYGQDMTSHMITCNDNGEGECHFWNSPDCEGAAMVEMSLEMMVESFMLPGGVEMICDGVDCPYAMVRSYDVNGTDDWMDSTTEEPYWSTGDNTYDPVWMTTDSMDSDSGSSSGEDWDCDATDFVVWEEQAVALQDCFQYNGTNYHIEYVCQDGEFTMQYYLNDECLGSPLHTEPHFAHEGICPQVNCFHETEDEVSFVTTEDGARPMDHLVAIGFAFITFVIGSV